MTHYDCNNYPLPGAVICHQKTFQLHKYHFMASWHDKHDPQGLQENHLRLVAKLSLPSWIANTLVRFVLAAPVHAPRICNTLITPSKICLKYLTFKGLNFYTSFRPIQLCICKVLAQCNHLQRTARILPKVSTFLTTIKCAKDPKVNQTKNPCLCSLHEVSL